MKKARKFNLKIMQIKRIGNGQNSQKLFQKQLDFIKIPASKNIVKVASKENEMVENLE